MTITAVMILTFTLFVSFIFRHVIATKHDGYQALRLHNAIHAPNMVYLSNTHRNNTIPYMNQHISTRIGSDAQLNKQSQNNSFDIVNELIRIEEMFEENGDFGEKQYVDFWNENIENITDPTAFAQNYTSLFMGNYEDEPTNIMNTQYLREGTSKIPKQHHYEHSSAYPESCACQLDSRSLMGVCWEYYHSQSNACYNRRCHVGFVCAQNSLSSTTCMKTTRNKKVIPNGDGTCSTVQAVIIAYVPYA